MTNWLTNWLTTLRLIGLLSQPKNIMYIFEHHCWLFVSLNHLKVGAMIWIGACIYIIIVLHTTLTGHASEIYSHISSQGFSALPYKFPYWGHSYYDQEQITNLRNMSDARCYWSFRNRGDTTSRRHHDWWCHLCPRHPMYLYPLQFSAPTPWTLRKGYKYIHSYCKVSAEVILGLECLQH